MQYSDNEMWKAVVDCDAKFDGKFFYAVKTVGVYCRPSCKSRTPLEKNVYYFETQQAAENSGFRPCKRCRPDLLNFAPAQEVTMNLKLLIDKFFNEKERLALEMKQIGVSNNHLAAIFKQQYGITPGQYLCKMRIDYAKKTLVETDSYIIDIAVNSGFETLSSFYTFFKKHTGTTPKEYRTQNR